MSDKIKIIALLLALSALAITASIISSGKGIKNPKVPNLYSPTASGNALPNFRKKVLDQDMEKITNNVIMIKPGRAREINKFELKTLKGDSIDSSNFKKQVTLLYVWGVSGVLSDVASREMPRIAGTLKKYKDKSFKVKGVAIRSSKKELEELVKKNIIPFDTAFVEGKTPIPVSFIPANIFIDKKGLVRAYYEGEMEVDARELIIEKLLKE